MLSIYKSHQRQQQNKELHTRIRVTWRLASMFTNHYIKQNNTLFWKNNNKYHKEIMKPVLDYIRIYIVITSELFCAFFVCFFLLHFKSENYNIPVNLYSYHNTHMNRSIGTCIHIFSLPDNEENMMKTREKCIHLLWKEINKWHGFIQASMAW